MAAELEKSVRQVVYVHVEQVAVRQGAVEKIVICLKSPSLKNSYSGTVILRKVRAVIIQRE